MRQRVLRSLESEQTTRQSGRCGRAVEPRGGNPIAGAGTDVPLLEAGRLASQYGGKASEWSKVTSMAPDHLQTHAYRNEVTGEVVELKSMLK